jgi:hypothetical protein
VTSVDESLDALIPYTVSGTAEITEFEDMNVSFSTNAVGVPHLVKVSYFPNWTVQGGEGVYRAAPSLMVVVPESENVSLSFTNRWVENLGLVVTAVTIAGLGTYAVISMRRRKASV